MGIVHPFTRHFHSVVVVLQMRYHFQTSVFSKLRFGHAKYIPADVMTNDLAIHHGDSVSSVNDAFNNLLAAAPPDQQKNMLGNRLYPLVESYRVILYFCLLYSLS